MCTDDSFSATLDSVTSGKDAQELAAFEQHHRQVRKVARQMADDPVPAAADAMQTANAYGKTARELLAIREVAQRLLREEGECEGRLRLAGDAAILEVIMWAKQAIVYLIMSQADWAQQSIEYADLAFGAAHQAVMRLQKLSSFRRFQWFLHRLRLAPARVDVADLVAGIDEVNRILYAVREAAGEGPIVPEAASSRDASTPAGSPLAAAREQADLLASRGARAVDPDIDYYRLITDVLAARMDLTKAGPARRVRECEAYLLAVESLMYYAAAALADRRQSWTEARTLTGFACDARKQAKVAEKAAAASRWRGWLQGLVGDTVRRSQPLLANLPTRAVRRQLLRQIKDNLAPLVRKYRALPPPGTLL